MSNYFIGSWIDAAIVERVKFMDFIATVGKSIALQGGSMQAKELQHPRVWEYCTAIALGNPMPGAAILDVGGAGSLFSWYLAHRGCLVTTTDLVEKNVIQCQEQNEELGYNVRAMKVGAADMTFREEFDVVYSINVIEHVMEHARHAVDSSFTPGDSHYWTNNYTPSKDEVKAETAFVCGMTRALKPGGLLIVSYDYAAFGKYSSQMKCAFFRSLKDVDERIVETSGLLDVDPVKYKLTDDDYVPLASTGIVVLRKQ